MDQQVPAKRYLTYKQIEQCVSQVLIYETKTTKEIWQMLIAKFPDYDFTLSRVRSALGRVKNAKQVPLGWRKL